MTGAGPARDGFHAITGASGGGKSALIDTLRARGHHVVEEAGRALVREARAAGSDALPWGDRRAFRDLLLARSIAQYDAAPAAGAPVFFDRGIPEAIGYSHLIGAPLAGAELEAACVRRYAPAVFVVPPWREIYVDDAERRKSWEDVLEDFHATTGAYRMLGYRLLEVPKTSIENRADFIETALVAAR